MFHLVAFAVIPLVVEDVQQLAVLHLQLLHILSQLLDLLLQKAEQKAQKAQQRKMNKAKPSKPPQQTEVYDDVVEDEALKEIPDVKEKKVQYVLESSSSESSEEEVVYVQRKKTKQQKKKKKQPKMVYVSDSSDEEEYQAEEPVSTYVPIGATPMTHLCNFLDRFDYDFIKTINRTT